LVLASQTLPHRQIHDNANEVGRRHAMLRRAASEFVEIDSLQPELRVSPVGRTLNRPQGAVAALGRDAEKGSEDASEKRSERLAVLVGPSLQVVQLRRTYHQMRLALHRVPRGWNIKPRNDLRRQGRS